MIPLLGDSLWMICLLIWNSLWKFWNSIFVFSLMRLKNRTFKKMVSKECPAFTVRLLNKIQRVQKGMWSLLVQLQLICNNQH